MWTYSILGHLSRVLALRIVLVILIGTAIGSVLPEFGNVLAARIDIGAHAFNIIFLVSLALCWHCILDIEVVSKVLRFWWWSGG